MILWVWLTGLLTEKQSGANNAATQRYMRPPSPVATHRCDVGSVHGPSATKLRPVQGKARQFLVVLLGQHTGMELYMQRQTSAAPLDMY